MPRRIVEDSDEDAPVKQREPAPVASKPRKSTPALTEWQRGELLSCWRSNPKPAPSQIKQLAKHVNAPADAVRSWLANPDAARNEAKLSSLGKRPHSEGPKPTRELSRPSASSCSV